MIRKLSSALANESVLLLGLTATVLVALNVPSKWQDVVQAAIPLVLALAVRGITTSPGTVAQAVTDAATNTAAALNTGSVGVVGNVTEKGQEVVDNVVSGVLSQVGGLVKAVTQPEKKEAA